MDEIDQALVPIRRKQKCCQHPSWVCPICRLHKDNIRDEQRLTIEYLNNKITEYELILTSLGFNFIPIKEDEKYVRMILSVPIVKISIQDEPTQHNPQDNGLF